MSDIKEKLKEMVKETSDEKLLRESKERFLTFDQEKMIQIHGLKHDDQALYVTFLGQEFRIDRSTAELTFEGRPADSDQMAVIFEWLTKAEIAPVPVGNWKSIADLCTNTTSTELTKYVKRLSPFEENSEALAAACEKLGGQQEKKADVSYVIPAFENFPVWFQYWEKDEEFPASVQFLFDACAPLHFRWATLWNLMDCIVNRMLVDLA
ncbi:MAG: DUF3786 domain-containing protein [Blautia sp.]|nr:DUF3786 domain-containing protein [Blautia sp.]